MEGFGLPASWGFESMLVDFYYLFMLHNGNIQVVLNVSSGMGHRGAGGKVLTGVALFVFGIVLAVLLYYWNAAAAPSGPRYHVVFDSVSLEPVSVDNARWEIALMLRNDGGGDVVLKKVYVNRKLVDEYGVRSGGSLSSKSVIGTSIPVEGVVIGSDSKLSIIVWIGSDLFSSGSQISLHVFDPNTLEYTRYIVLN
jgi:hypothetical protein